MRRLALALMLVPTLALCQEPATLQFRYLYTIGSKSGIHPPRILNRKAITGALGKSEHPYGLGYPTSVTIDHQQRVWIADSGTVSVHVFDTASGAYREFRQCGQVPLQIPWGLAADSAGRIYLTDAGSGAICVFNPAGEFDHSLFAAGEHPLERPGAIALSEDGRSIYVADTARNVVVELNREGEVQRKIPLPANFDPSAIAVVDNQIEVLGSRPHRVQIFSPAGVPRGELRWDDIQFPSAFGFDPAHRTYFAADPRLMIVQAFDCEGRNLGAFGGRGEGVDQMERISGIFVDGQGRVYVIDAPDGKVVVFEVGR